MSSKKIAEFPAVEAKLQKPTKQSAFERQRAEAEAKRAREEAETAAVLREFEKSFDHDDDDDSSGPRRGGGQFLGPRGPPGGGGMAAPRRHFGASGLKSGPGSLGPPPSLKSGPGSLGPPPSSYGKKRGFDAYKQERDRDGSSRAGYDERGEAKSVLQVFNTSEDEHDESTDARQQEVTVAKPTLRLSQIPPGTSPAAIKALIPSNLTVENVKIMPPSGPSTDRKCTVAIVTLSQETPATDIDAAVSALQNRYLGYGFYLSLHRHLSSAVTSSVSTSGLGATPAGSRPFGAKPVAQRPTPGKAHMQHAFHRGFAPPAAYGPSAGGPLNRNSILHVPVKPPNDIKMLRLINKTLESVLEHGPEFEALLMSRPEVQREEKWAWIWDARSEGGIWYRWRMWEIVTGASLQRNKGKYLPLFDGSHAWKAPEKGVPFEYTTSVDEIVSDSEYNSSDDEDLDGDGNREQNGDTEAENTFLNPLDKAKLTHLLSRLPTTLSKIRKGDIARVTAFALMHASRGADEVVDMIVSNIEKPLALTALNPEHSSRNGREKNRHGDDPEVAGAGSDDKAEKETAQDTSGASLVSLYVVSDILASSSTSGVRHVWRFRQIFEGALRDRKIFEMLGLMAEKHNWGRLRAEKWKRSVGMILHLWEGWCVFPAESQDLFTNSFNNPPTTTAREQGDDEGSKKGRWKVVDAPTSTASGQQSVEGPTGDDDVQGEPMDEDDVEGEPMDEDDVEGEPMDEEDVEGEPMDEEDVEGEPLDDDEALGKPSEGAQNASKEEPGPSAPVGDGDAKASFRFTAAPNPSKSAAAQGRRRMRAVDMFTGPDDSD
ncbi:hypothetical protein ACRALDRAFT_1082000 [Sodiomyces alcalophilus JCM 7366]|uniref:uncharacterized protein n=1 Tax=Sodiomyces alcalophilus JCM 7366 TaxID=591952 RepID=UPI0039B4F054